MTQRRISSYRIGKQLRTTVIAVAICLAMYGCATAPTTPKPYASTAAHPSNELPGVSLAEASELFRLRRFGELEERFSQPLIAHFNARRERESHVIYSASSMVEGVYCLALAASKNQDAVLVDGRYGFAFFVRGFGAVERGDWSLAEQCLRSAVDISPGSSLYLTELGHILQSTKRYSAALEIYENALSTSGLSEDPSEIKALKARALRGKGFSLIELGRLDEAEVLYNECLEINPDDRTAKAELDYIMRLKWRRPAGKS